MITPRAPLLLAVLFLSACSDPEEATARPLQDRTAEEFVWQSVMRAGGTLEIKGVNGSVVAIPASGGAARVEASRIGRRGADPTEVEIAVVEHAGGVTICAVYPSGDGRPNECLPGDEGRLNARNSRVRVEFRVAVPAGIDFVGRNTNGPITAGELAGRVEAYSTNGDVQVDGGSDVVAFTTNGSVTVRSEGEAEARTTNGRIVAELRSVDATGDPLRFSSTNGSVTVRLPAGANANVEARTANGSIESDLPLSIERMSRRVLSGSLGAGGREIELRTTNGSIRIEGS